MEKRQVCIIAGAGPAGLTAAACLLRHTGVQPIVAEATGAIGGISQTVRHEDLRMDIGGHRFFSRSPWVREFWRELLPYRASEGRPLEKMLRRPRVSRIYFRGHMLPYPLRPSMEILKALGVRDTLRVAGGYIAARLHPRKVRSLEDYYVNCFGRPLYSMFFEGYTRKVWGEHPSALSSQWGSQRVKGLSLSGLVADMWRKFWRRRGNVHTSLIEEFDYPALGPGQLWEKLAGSLEAEGAQIHIQTQVSRVHTHAGKVCGVTLRDAGGERYVECDYFFSSIPVSHLLPMIEGLDIPTDVMDAARSLPYRNFRVLGLLVPKTLLAVPEPKDNWIYIQDERVKLGRLQVFPNWSEHLQPSRPDSLWLGLEYFCSDTDPLWKMDDEAFADIALKELILLGILNEGASVRGLVSKSMRMPRAYPAYSGSYSQMGQIRGVLDSIQGLFCIGRNGQHRYNNMDHSMLTAMEAARCVERGEHDRSRVWDVNTEEDYHEAES